MTGNVETSSEVRPFHVHVPEEALDELRRHCVS
jgi:hypothetical protein